MLRIEARKVVYGLACVGMAGAVTLSLTTCGSGASVDTQSSASKPPRPANWEVRPAAVKRAAEEHKRHARVVQVAFTQARQVQRCISRSGYTTLARISHNRVRGLGVVPVMRATRESFGGPLPVPETGLRTDNGSYVVGIAPTRAVADVYVSFESGVAGSSDRDYSSDGLVSVQSANFGGLATYAAERATVASCAFSVPAASGHPKWVSRSLKWRPIVTAG